MGARSEARTEFLSDIITTAVEGGVNGWARVEQYQYVIDGEVSVFCGERVGDGARATIVDVDGGARGELTVDTIAAAIAKITSGTVSVGGYVANAIMEASRENDAGEIDAGLADTIAQVAVLGEEVYG